MIEETLHLKEQQSGILPSLVENSFQAFDEFYNAEEQKDQTRSIHTFIPPISVPLYNGFPRGTGLGEFMSGSSEQLMSYIFNQGLVKADIQGQNLHKLPDDLIMQTGIAKLNVSSNYLNRIDSPSDIALFKTIGQTLRNLIISNNILTEISRDLLSTCQNLEFIDVSHNLLRDISFVRGLRSLRELDIRHNRILHLDNSLNSLPSLVDLRFDWPSMIASRYTGASTVTQANTICLNELKDKVARHDMYYYRHFTEDYDTQGMTEALIKSSVWQQQVFVLSISNTNSDLLEYSVNNDCHRSMIGMLDKLNDTNSNFL